MTVLDDETILAHGERDAAVLARDGVVVRQFDPAAVGSATSPHSVLVHDRKQTQVFAWDPESGCAQPLDRLDAYEFAPRLPTRVLASRYIAAADGRGNDHHVAVWDIASGARVQSIDAQLAPFAISDDLAYLVGMAVRERVAVWTARDESRRDDIPHREPPPTTPTPAPTPATTRARTTPPSATRTTTARAATA